MKKQITAGLMTLILGASLSAPLTADASQKAPALDYKNVLVINTHTNSTLVDKPLTQFVASQDITATVDGSDTNYLIKAGTVMTTQRTLNDQTLVTVPGQDQSFWVTNLANVTYRSASYHYTKKDYQNLSKQGQLWSKKLSKQEVKAIGNYSADGYKKINTALREPQKKASATTKKRIKLIEHALTSFTLQKPITVYRGTSPQNYQAGLKGQPSQIGATYSDAAFASTSTSRQIADSFQSKIMFKMNIPAGQSGSYIASVSQNKDEKEYLLNPNTQFVVTNIQNIKSNQTTTVTQLKNNKKKYHIKNTHNNSYQLITLTAVNK